MNFHNVKRGLALMLAFVMVFSLCPVQAFAAEDHDHAHEIQEQMDALLAKYVGNEAIDTAVAALDLDTDLIEAVIAIEDMEYAVAELPEEEIQSLLDANPEFLAFAQAVMDRFAAVNDIGVYTDVSVLDGQVTISDSANTGSGSGTSYTATAKGSMFSKKTNTITVTNASGARAQLSFDYSASAANSFTIANASAAASGTYNVVLEAGASVSISITSNSGLSNTTATLTLSNIALVEVKENSSVTFNYDSSLGSVTVGGTAVTSGSAVDISGTDGAALVATVNSGTTFLGWVDGTGKILSTAASYTLTPASDMTVKAAFAQDGGAPWFGVGAATQKSVSSGLLGMSKIYYYQVNGLTHLFDDLNAAAAAASGKAVVLMNNATLPAGTYTIPSGVTLLIPFDANNTMYTTQVQNIGTYAKPTAYRTLTMADGANLVINGAMSISAMQKYAAGANNSYQNGGAPTGATAFVKMQGSSNITVNNGGTLYAYGFVTGSGSVTANNGATVYEMFQFSDFRGGTQSADMDNGVFPFSQYYIQNIEVPMTLYAGAKENVYTTIYMSSADFGTSIGFLAKSGAMFNLTSGYVVKKYDGATDRQVLELHGAVEVASINMSLGTSSINSADYDLPLNNNFHIKAESGSSISIKQDLVMLPGTIMELDEGASCTVNSGNNVFVYDADQWAGYCGSGNATFIPVIYAPGRTYTRTAADLVDAKIVVNGTLTATDGKLYTTAGGANICSTGNGVVEITKGEQTVTHQLVQGTGYTEIPITPAKLKHGDGTYLTSGTNTYTYSNARWTCATHTEETVAGKDATCAEPGLTEGKKCSVCGFVIVAQEEISALPHTEVTIPGKDATCAEPGLTEGKHCSVCNEVLVAQETVEKLPHTEVVDEAVAPTCTATGLTEGKHCSVCSEVLVAQTEVAALGHSYTSEVTTAPGCESTGIETFTCGNCGDTYTEVIPATGHTEAAAVKENEVAADCTNAGSYDNVVYCSVCDAELSRETITVPSLGHTEGEAVVENRVESTCTVAGSYDEVVYCSECGEELSRETNALELAAHTEGEVVVENEKAATCTAEGSYDNVVYCTVCDAELSRNTVTVEKVAHTEGEAVVENCVESTCTVAGSYDEVVYCSECGEELSRETNALELAAHTEGDVVIENEVAATCGADGSYDNVVYCSVCDAELSRNTVVVPATGEHVYATETERKDATCTEDGYVVMACACGATETTTLTATGHTEGEVVVENEKAATCTAEGSYDNVVYCSVCNAELSRDTVVVPALGHNFEDGKCSVCGEADPDYVELFDISFASMTMANSLNMNFAFEKGHMENWSGCYAEIVKEYADGRDDVVQTIDLASWKSTTISGVAHYYVTFTGIAAKEMTDNIYVTIYNAEGAAISNVWIDSVRAQAMRNLAKANVSELSRTMVVDMLNYGAAAQSKFSYNTAELANGLLSEEQKGYATDTVSYTDTSIRGSDYRSNVLLKSNIQFMMAFSGIDQSMKAVVTFTNHRGVENIIEINGSEFSTSGSYYVITVDETVIADGRQDINCKIYNGDTLVTEVTDSIASYAARASQNTGNELYEMLMKFSDSAYAYLHS